MQQDVLGEEAGKKKKKKEPTFWSSILVVVLSNLTVGRVFLCLKLPLSDLDISHVKGRVEYFSV